MNTEFKNKKLIIFAAPSGSGKTTLMKAVNDRYKHFHFSVSATTRPIRPGETDGIDYRFLTIDTFKTYIKENKLLEWEEVYKNKFYGTLKSELEISDYILFDMDVKGALNLKKDFGDSALSIFVNVDLDTLKERLEKRNTESETDLTERLNKAKKEAKYKDLFDIVINNNDLEQAKQDSINVVTEWMKCCINGKIV